MARKPSKKVVGFAQDYIKTGNGTQAALNNYDLPKDAPVNSPAYMTAAAIASENLKKPKVLALIEDFAEIATTNIKKLANEAENETVKLNANRDMLDRAGYKPIEKSIQTTISVNAEDLNKHKDLREEYEQKLLERYKNAP